MCEMTCFPYNAEFHYINKCISLYCYKSVQRFRVTCLFTGQYDMGEYGTIAGVI